MSGLPVIGRRFGASGDARPGDSARRNDLHAHLSGFAGVRGDDLAARSGDRRPEISLPPSDSQALPVRRIVPAGKSYSTTLARPRRAGVVLASAGTSQARRATPRGGRVTDEVSSARSQSMRVAASCTTTLPVKVHAVGEVGRVRRRLRRRDRQGALHDAQLPEGERVVAPVEFENSASSSWEGGVRCLNTDFRLRRQAPAA